MALSDFEHKQLEVFVGLPILNGEWVQIPLCDSIFGNYVHYELCGKKQKIELHFEPENPHNTVRAFANYLEDKLTTNKTIKIVGKKSKFRVFYIEGQNDNNDILSIGREIKELHAYIQPILKSFIMESMTTKEIINEIASFYETEKNKLPYNLNIIDELHANENAHTRILIKVLQYKDTVKSFVKKIPTFKETIISKPHIECFEEFLDGIIAEDHNYAIIIENKICNAPNQKEQLERYIKTAKSKYNVSEKQIWVIYLTKDGTKEYETESAVVDTIKDNYVKLNYRDDILPWLKNEVLPSFDIHEEILICAMKQYIDHLEGLFWIRESEKNMSQIMQAKLMEALSISEDDDYKTKYQKIKEFKYQVDTLWSIISYSQEYIKKKVIDSFETITKDYFSSRGIDVKTEYHINGDFYQIKLTEWSSNVHLEWIPFNAETLIIESKMVLEFHIEHEPIVAQKLLADEEYIKLNYQYNNRAYYQQSKYLDKCYILMSEDERKKILFEMYNQFDIIIQIVNKYYQEV